MFNKWNKFKSYLTNSLGEVGGGVPGTFGGGTGNPYVDIFVAIGKAVYKFLTQPAVQLTLFVASGVNAHIKTQELKKTGQEILLTKFGTGDAMPVIYGTRRVAGTVVYMGTADYQKELFVVYAIAGHEIDSFNLETLQIDGNPVSNVQIYRDGFIASDGTTRITSSGGTGTKASGDFFGSTQTEVDNILAGTNPPNRPRMVFNCHTGSTSQAADPMLVGCLNKWTTDHKLTNIAYIACNFEYDIRGQFTGLPNLTVVVNGKKLYDPRADGSITGGTGSQRANDASTHTWSANPSLALLDYMTNDDYGKGLDPTETTGDIDLGSFQTAADACDVSADTIPHNDVVVEAASTTTDIVRIAAANNEDYVNFKIGSSFTVSDGVTTYIDNKRLIDKESIVLDDTGAEGITFLKLIFEDGAVDTAITTNTTCTFTETQVKFDCHGVIDTEESILENTKALVANMRGIFTYSNGQYSVKVEGAESSVVSLDEDDIFESGLNLSLENKEAKYNKVEAEFYNAQKRYETDTTYYTGESGDDFLTDDGDEILETRIQLPFCTNQRIAYNHAKALLKRSRSQKTVAFVATPKVLQAKVGEVITITSSNMGLSNALFRITNMVINPDLNIEVTAIEYQANIYDYVTPPDESIGIIDDPVDGQRVEKPTNLQFTAKDTSTGEPAKLTWTDSTKYPSYEFRVVVKTGNSSTIPNKTRFDRRTQETFFYLDGVNIDSGFTAFVSAINTLGTESDAAELAFAVTTAPVTTPDIEQGSVGGFNFTATKMYYGTAGNFNNTDTAVYFDNAGQFSLKDKLSWNGTTLDISGNLTVENTISADKILLDGNNLADLFESGDSGSDATLTTNSKIQRFNWVDGLSTTHYGLYIDNTGTYGEIGVGTVSQPSDAIHVRNSGARLRLETPSTGYVRVKGSGTSMELEAGNTGAGYDNTSYILMDIAGNDVAKFHALGGMELPSLTPTTTTNRLYNNAGTLYWNGNQVGVGAVNTVTNMADNRILTASGSNSVNGEANLTFDGSTLALTGSQTISGDLTVNGTTVTLNTATLDVEDKNITLNYSTGDSSASANGAGITIQDAVNSTTDATILWDATNDEFDFSHTVDMPTLKLNGTTVTATATELNYVDGVTSNIQTQLDAKQATITGAATTITTSNLTASRALISNASGKVAVSDVTSTELGYLDGVTSAIQTQLDTKVDTTGTPANTQLAIFNDSDTIKGNANLTFDGATGSASDNTLEISGGSTHGPHISLLNTTGGSTTDYALMTHDGADLTINVRNGTSKGGIKFQGNTGTTPTTYGGFDASGNFEIGTTDVIEAGTRNLVNIGTISSDKHIITSTGTIGLTTPANGYLQVTDGTNTLALDPNEIFCTTEIVVTATDFDIRSGSFSVGDQVVITSARALTNIASVATTGNITVDYTGNSTNDAGIAVFNDANDWGIKIDKDGTATYGLLISADGAYPFQITNSSGTEKFRVDAAGDIETVRNINASGTITAGGVVTATSTSGHRFGRLTLRDDSVEEHQTDTDTAGVALNYIGYNGSTTRFRTTSIFDGKQQLVARFTGSDKTLNVVSGYKLNGTTVIDSSRNLTNIGTISSGAITSSGVIQATGYLAVEGTSGNTGSAGDRWIGGDGTAGTWFYNVPTGSNHYFAVNNTNQVAINATGVGIGTSSPDLKLHVAHSDSNNGLLLEHTAQASGYQYVLNARQTEGLIFQRWANGSFSSNTMTLDYNNRVGIGTTVPEEKLQVEGNIRIHGGTGGKGSRLDFGDEFRVLEYTTNDTLALKSPENMVFIIDNNNNETDKIFHWKTNTNDADTGGTSLMTLNESGQLGIGTSSPIANLQVGDGTGSETLLLLGSNSNTTSSQILFGDNTAGADPYEYGMGIRYDSSNNVLHFDDNYNDGGSANNVIMTIDRDDQRVGIGQTNPTRQLHLTNSANALAKVESTGANYAGIDFENTSRLWYAGIRTELGHGFGIKDEDANRVRLAIDTSGNVDIPQGNFEIGGQTVITSARNIQSIGTITASGTIHTTKSSNDAFLRATTTGAGAYVRLDSGTSGYFGIQMTGGNPLAHKWFIGSYGTNDFTIKSAPTGTEYLRVTTGGNVGIGDTAPPSTLTVLGDNSADVASVGAGINGLQITRTTGSGENLYAYIGNGSFTGWSGSTFPARIENFGCNVLEIGSQQSTPISFGTNNTERMRIDSSGRVGIGTSSPAEKLQVEGNIRASGAYKIGANKVIEQVGTRLNIGDADNNDYIVDITGYGDTSSIVLNDGFIDVVGDFDIAGSLSKNSGSFKIDHPLKPETHHLVHSFVESPQADNIYSGEIELIDGRAEINLDAEFNMTAGTIVALNRGFRTFTTNETNWDNVKGKVVDNILTIECQNSQSTATVSWLVIGERQDKEIYESSLTDDNGKVIVEPVKNNI